MSPAILSLLFDGTLALLLVVTISYCSRLNKKIRQLQDGRSELAEMIERFDKSTARATLSLSELQTVSKKITEALQLKIDKANFLADDLAFLIEKSSKLATQLEQQKKQQAEIHRPSFNQAGSFAMHKPASQSSASHIEKSSPPKPITAKSGIEQLMAASAQSSPSVASIEAMLQKLSAPAASSRTSTPEKESAPRTEAERELLNAIKSGR